MNSIIELFVSGATTGTTIGQIDLYGDEPISLKLSINDIKDISKRNSSVSQTFTIPANKNNNTLLNHIFNIGSDSRFDPRKKCPAYLLVDSEMVIQGTLQLTNINTKNQNPVSYEVIIYGETANLVKSIGDGFLTDLDFSELDHIFSVDNIMESWTANTQNLGYYYPLIDYGYDLSVNDLNKMIPAGSLFNGTSYPNGGLNPSIFKPALSSKYLLDKIMKKAGFSYESNFLNSSAFTETIIPFNGDTKITSNPTYTNELRFKAGLSQDVVFSAQTYFPFTDLNPYYELPRGILKDYRLRFNDLASADYGDNAGDYNTTTFSYVASETSVQQFGASISVNVQLSGSPSVDSQAFVRFLWYRKLGGVRKLFETQTVNYPTYVKQSGVTYTMSTLTTKLDNPASSVFYPAQAGEEFFLYIDLQGSNYSNPGMEITTTIKEENTFWYNVVFPDLVVGGKLFYNQFVPKQVKQIDILKNIISMFNLFIVPSKANEKHLIIEPRQDYISSGVIKDWTNKLDLTSDINQSIISESQSKQILFTYKEDKDYLNTFYKSNTSTIYGQYIKNIDNEWLDSKSQQKIEITFSPTPLENVINSEEIIISKIGKVESNGAWGRTDHNIRFLRKNQTPLTTVNDTITMLGKSPQYSYPYAGHLSTPFSSDNTPVDYNFGTVTDAFYSTPGYSNLQDITPNNLTYLYWRDYLNDINDKNSRIIKCKMKLSPNDIATFNFNDNIFIDGLTPDGGHYFIVQTINYTPTSNVLSDVELIKISKKAPEELPKSVSSSNTTALRNSITLGGAQTLSRNSIAMGETVVIGANSENTFANGTDIIIGNNSNNISVVGTNIVIGDNITNSYVTGNNIVIENEITTGTTGTTATTISGITLLGVNNYTATTLVSDTVYMPNIQLTSSAATINGTPISAVTQSSNLWASGTGVSSVVQLNTTAPNIASGDYSHAEGIATSATTFGAHAEGINTLSNGSGFQSASHAEGYGTTASGNASHSEGYYSIASGARSHSEGYVTTASGNNSHSEGYGSKASGIAAHAEGGGGGFGYTGGTASGDGSHAEGSNTTASGNYSHSEGFGTVASGNASHSEGSGSKATAEISHAEGFETTASGDYSHSEGAYTVASGEASHAEGGLTKAIGTRSHAEGEFTTASGLNSHAEGYDTIASGEASHSEGFGTVSLSAYTHAGGFGAKADHYGEWARSSNGVNFSGFGQYGIIDIMTSTTNAALKEMFIGSVANTRITIGVGQAYRYTLTMIAQNSSTGAVKEWEAKGLIKNVGGTTSMVGSSNVSTFADASMATASLGVAANNTNDSLLVEATGIAATNISWYGKMEYTRIN
jgi:hypothetical protein